MSGTVLNIAENAPKKDPAWMVVTDEGVTLTLSTASTLNGVKQKQIILRSPTVREVRACQKAHPNDDLAVDTMLFASLASISEPDLLALTVKDYNRIKDGYFRLVEEDEL